MKYIRPPYDPNATEVDRFSNVFNPVPLIVPKLDYPISPKENFRRAAARNDPLWVPNSTTDMTNVMVSVLTGAGEADFTSKQRHDFRDFFDVEWTYVPEAGGPMLKPGTQYLDDITNWETGVKFPKLEEFDIAGRTEAWKKAKYDPDKITHVNIGLGCTERLVSLLGGYTEAMCAMALEPEAVRDYLDAFADFECRFVDALLEHLDIDFITYHDDWGTERDTFFSPQMMEDLVFEPTKKIFGHIKSKGIVVEHHCCGNIKRFAPYMCQTGADFMQLQARANDIPALKREYGDRLGFNTMIMPAAREKDAINEAIHENVDTYAKGGGWYTSVTIRDNELMWDAVEELFYYSREFYDAEQGRD
ncbi:MAG: hypothetical protein IK101_04090 [Oscillospiraceae bacterium]|nr:hypothetical protein [Oscillospiraceae bacterium]